MKRMRKNNQGFTLPELIVTIAILSIVVSACFMFLFQCLKSYRNGSEESNLQNESQLTMTQLENLVLNGSQGVGISPAYDMSTSTTGYELYIYDHDVVETSTVDGSGNPVYSYETKLTATYIYREGNQLLYCERDIESTLDPTTNKYSYTFKNAIADDKVNAQVLADYVKGFSVDVSNLISKKQIGFQIIFENLGRTYTAKKTVTLRNQILADSSGSLNDFFDGVAEADAQNDVMAVDIVQDSIYMWAGTTMSSPFTVNFTKKDGSTYQGGSTIWTIDPEVSGASINRRTGAITLDDTVTSNLTVKATALSTINNSKGDTGKYKSDTATVYVKNIAQATLAELPDSDNNPKTMDVEFTLAGQNFQVSEDMQTVSVQVIEGNNLKPVITQNTSGSSASALKYNIAITRPANYNGKNYTLRVRATVNGNPYDAALSIKFSGSDANKKVVAVRVVGAKDGESYDCVAGSTASYNVSSLRGDIRNLSMQLLYEGENEYETLSADEWGIKSDDPAVALSADGASVYQATYNVKNYTEKTSVTLSTTYSDENGDEQVGPTLILDFPVVEIKPVGLVDLKQTAFPIAKGKDGQLEFKVTGLKDPSIYVVDADSSEISATASDCTVSVSVPSGAGNALTLTVGAKTQSGTKVRDITYTVSMKPGNTNVYNTAGSQKLGIFIPYVTAIKNYNSSLSAPAEGQSVVLYTADGKEIKYQNVPGSTYGSITYQYKATYDGKTYFYYAQGQQWRLLP